MYILLPLLLIATPTPTIYPSLYCEEIAVILNEGVEEGVLSLTDAEEILARCARAPEFSSLGPSYETIETTEASNQSWTLYHT